MKLKPNELVIITRMGTYPLPDSGDNASKIRWRSFSPFWWGVMQGLLEGLLQPILWDEWSDNLRDEIVKHFIPNEPECPPVPPPPVPPPPVPPPPASGSAWIVGSLGLTIDEMESLIMAWSMRGQLAWVNGVLCYWSDGCCEWVPIEIVSGIAPPSAIQKPDTGWTIDKWIEENRPPVPPILPIAPPPPELHITAESILCAKISGIFSALKDLLTDLREVLILLPAAGAVSVEAIASAIAATFLSAGAGLVLVLAVGIAAAVVGIGAAVLADEINEYLTDWETYLPLWVCWSVGAGIYDAGTTVTTNDFEMTLNTLFGSVEGTPTASNNLMKLLRAVPLTLWDMEAQQAASSTPCACDDYKPYNYSPPLPMGSFQFTLQRFYKAASATGGIVNPTAGEALEGIDTPAGEDGTLYGDYPQTELVAQDSGYWWHEFGVILEMSEQVDLSELRMTAIYPQGEPTSGRSIGAHVYAYDEVAGEWELWGTVADTTSPYTTEWVISAAKNDIKYVSIAFYVQSNDSAAAKTARLASIRLSGTFSAGSFVQLELGDIATP